MQPFLGGLPLNITNYKDGGGRNNSSTFQGGLFIMFLINIIMKKCTRCSMLLLKNCQHGFEANNSTVKIYNRQQRYIAPGIHINLYIALLLLSNQMITTINRV